MNCFGTLRLAASQFAKRPSESRLNMFIARESQYRTEPYDNKHHNKETLYRSTALSQHRGISPIVVSSSAIRDEILNFDHPRTRVDPERFWHRKRPWAVEGIEKITWNTKRSVLYCIPTGVERNGLSFGRFIIIFFKKRGSSTWNSL